jgi:4-amino-4-deoxychorismate lyase
MFPVFESIRLDPTGPTHLKQHLLRMQNTAQSLWQCQLDFPLLAQQIHEHCTDQLQKCRVLYNANEYHIECSAYQPKIIQQMKVAYDDVIDYHYKWTDRYCLTQHLKGLRPYTEVLICKQGLLSDTSYSNIALWNGEEWHTPAAPLFHGIKRKLLIEQGMILEKEINVQEIESYNKVALINAMLDLGDLEVSTDKVQI